MKHYTARLFEGFEWKIVISVLAAAVSAIEHFYTPLIWGFLALFCLDLLTGIIKSKRKGIPISSSRLRDSVTKLCGYMLLITALTIASFYEKPFVPMITLVYYYFMFTELRSIVENVQEMGVKVPTAVTNNISDRISGMEANTTVTVEAKVVSPESTTVVTTETTVPQVTPPEPRVDDKNKEE